MKKLLMLLVFSLSSTAFADNSDCAALPAGQQAVFAAYNTYLDTGTDLDGVFFIGAIGQYQTDAVFYESKTNPNRGNDHDVDLFESSAANLCVGDKRQGIFEKRALAGNRTAIKIMLMYSAIYIVDGAGAEDLGEIQDSLLEKYPKLLKSIQRENAAFFKQHPIDWVNHEKN